MSPKKPKNPPAVTGAPPRRRRRRWKRWVVIVPVVLLGSGLGLLQTPAAGWLVEPIVAAQTGMEVRAGSVRVTPLGTVIIANAVLRAPGMDGTPGEVLRADRITARIDWTATLTGSPGLKSIRLAGPDLRLSQDIDTGVLNAAAFKLFSGDGGGKTPTVVIERGTIELGEHRGAAYTGLRRWSVVGDLEAPDASGVSVFEFAARPATEGMGAAASGTLGLTGTIGPDGVAATLDGLRLEDWPATIVPSRMRDLYARLDLSGQLLPTRFTVDTTGRVTVRMTLDGVDLNLPFNEEYSLEGSGDLLRMRRTRGTVDFGTDGLAAQISGLIDELRYDVSLDYRGLDREASFDSSFSTRFRLDDSFRPRRFLPQEVIEKINMFESPAADVAATVRVSRPERGAKMAIAGDVALSNGRASYGKFPYPFTNLRGRVSFTQDNLVIERVEGDGPTGATLAASGRFDGLGEDSRVELRIEVRGVPLDDEVMAALNPGRRQLVEALFNPRQYEALIADGLIRTPDGRGGRDAPLFVFGGATDVDLVLRRTPERPADNRWTKETSVRLPHAGLVPQHFPLPIVAKGVELRITDEGLSMTGGHYEGLTGGEARVTAELDQRTARPGQDPLPVVEIKARGFPVDARMLAAIPGYREAPDPEKPVSLRSILDNLRVSGLVDCDALIGPRSDGVLGYDIEANFAGASARPVPWSPDERPPPVDAVVLDDMSGTVYVTERLIVVDMDGLLQSPDQPLAPTRVSLLTQLTMPEKRGGLGDVERTGGLLPIQQGPPLPGPALYADARADGLDLAMPVEHAAAVVSPDLALRLSELRDTRRPDGVVSLRAEMDGLVGGHTETVLAVDRIDSLSFEHAGVRHSVGPSRGSMELTLGVRPRVRFEGLRLPIMSGGVNAGRVSLDGDLPLVRYGRGNELADGQPLRATLTDARVEAPVIGQVVSAFAGVGAGAWLSDRKVAGLFDLDITLSPVPGASGRGEVTPPAYALPSMSAVGVLQPRSLALDLPGSRVEFASLTGRVSFEGMGGRVDAIEAVSPGLSLRVDGPWSFRPGEGADLDLTMRVEGERFDDPVRTLLPTLVLAVLDRFQVKAEGVLRTDDLRITGRGVGTPSSVLAISGAVDVTQASAVVGLPITEMDGRVGFEAEVTPEGTGYAIDLTADRLRAGRLRVESATATILADASRPGVVLIPEIQGRVHGGRIAGSAQARTTGSESRYWVDIHGSDIRAAPVFDDLILPPGGLEGPPLPGEEGVRSAWSVSDDYTRGLLDTDISITGVAGDLTKTAGRGVVRVAGGSVIALPGLINLVEFSNLRAPVGAQLDLAEAVFYIDGTALAFEQLTASSNSVEIVGYGTMDWVTRELDLRFRSRAVRPIPLFSDLLESVRDELITTKITGSPGALRYSAETFGATRRLMRALMGEPQSEQERLMSAVEAASLNSKNRDTNRERPAVLPSRQPAAWAEEDD